MRRISNIVYISVFILTIILVPLCIFITKDKEFSENENRYLSEKPKISINDILTGKYFENFEKYIDDQFVFRNNLYEIKTQLQILSGNKDINGVYLAKDNYLIEKKLENEVNKERLQNNINKINKFAENNKDKSIQIMVVPTASLILKDKLPQNSVEYNQNEILNIINDNIKNATFIDLRDKFLTHKEEYIYYKTDHHWTSLGSYYAYQEWCKYKNINTNINNYSREIVTTEFKGSLYSKVLNKNVETDKIELFKLKNEIDYEVNYNFNKTSSLSIYDFKKLKTKDKYQVFLGGNYPELKIKTSNRNGKNLLIIKDSYANSFIPFLLNNYENICVIDMRYFKENLKDYMRKNEIFEILILYNVENFIT